MIFKKFEDYLIKFMVKFEDYFIDFIINQQGASNLWFWLDDFCHI